MKPPQTTLIAIVDDDESVREAIESWVKSVGHEAATFSSGEEFSNWPRLTETSCLILDEGMPGMSGLELQRRLADSGHRIPIVFITAHAGVVEDAQAWQGGAVSILQKPVSEGDLIGALQTALRFRNSLRDSRRSRVAPPLPASRHGMEESAHESEIRPGTSEPPIACQQSPGHSPLARFVGRKLQGAQFLGQLIRQTTNWLQIWKYRHQKHLLPPLRLRNGVTLNHGERDNPLLMLDEVYVNQWYDVGAVPPPNANMLDIGANIGAVTSFWAAIAPSLNIHAYEPNPSAFDSLQRNVEENSLRGRVRIFPEAVGRGLGELNLWVDVPTELSTGYLQSSPVGGGKRIAVPMVGLDEVWSRIDKERIWLLKIDAEGAEVDILEGASKAILEAIQYAIVEYHDQIYPGASQRCRRALEAAGFQCRVLVHPWEEGIIYARRG